MLPKCVGSAGQMPSGAVQGNVIVSPSGNDGIAFGPPVGITFMPCALGEATLLRLAYVYEQATMHRKPPRYAPPSVLPPELPLDIALDR